MNMEALQSNPALVRWLASGERGISSNTIVQHLTGLKTMRDGYMSHPYDPDDLSRCRKLLEAVPLLKLMLPGMATCSPEWAALVARWDELCSLMDEEAPRWNEGIGSAPKTYELMASLRKNARAAA
jgi:hypothetical protein